MTEQKQNIGTYIINGIKFQYLPIASSTLEGNDLHTQLRATKGVSSYILEIKGDKIGELLPIAKNDVNIFNRVMINFLNGMYKNNIEIKEEIEIVITVEVDVIGEIQKMRLILAHEDVGETILLKRKIEYLSDIVEKYEKTKVYWINMQTYTAIYNIRTGSYRLIGDQKEICDGAQPINNLTRYGREFMESKTEGFYREICNYDLFRYLEQNNDYKEYLDYVNKIGNSSHIAHPILMYYSWWLSTRPVSLLKFYLFLINHIGYELTEIGLNFFECHRRGDLVGLKINPTKNKFRYEIENLNEVNNGYIVPNNDIFHTAIKSGKGTMLILHSIKKIMI